MRLARAYAFGVAFSFALLAAASATAGRSSLSRFIADALSSASWVVAGLSALSAARDLERQDQADGFGPLMELRGASRRERALARTLASAGRITLFVCLPALAVLFVGALRTWEAGLLQWLARWLVLIVVYAAGLGVTLSLLARGSALLAAPHARVLLLVFVFAPELLRTVAGWPIPSLPSACGSFLTLAREWGASPS
jgi:hypothetical protein